MWGCPVYVLDPQLQDARKIPRWQPRSRRGVFLGFSRSHAATVPLILNCRTLSISPQFHVVFDDWFSTIVPFVEKAIDPTTPLETPPPGWYDLFGTSHLQFNFDDDDPHQFDEDWLTADELMNQWRADLALHVPPPLPTKNLVLAPLDNVIDQLTLPPLVQTIPTSLVEDPAPQVTWVPPPQPQPPQTPVQQREPQIVSSLPQREQPSPLREPTG